MPNKKILSMLYPACRLVTPWGASSGIFISDTEILTVYHAIDKAITRIGTLTVAKEIRHPIGVEVFSGKKTQVFQAQIQAYDEAQDIALLKLKKGVHKYSANLIPENLISQLELFDEVYTIGSSLGHEPLPSRGIITYKKEELDFGFYWMTDSQISVGNSGGGVFIDLNGEFYLIGITTSMLIDDETDQVTHLTHFIPPTIIYKFLESTAV